MSYMTADDVLRLALDHDVKFIRLQFTDLFGTLKNIAITVDHLARALDNQYMFDGSSIDGFVRIEESDMVLKPDPNTFSIFPWRPQSGKVARLICDIATPENDSFEGDPRHILKRALAHASELGYTFYAGPECEFFLFHTDNNGRPTTETHDNGSYFDLGPSDLGEDARRDICLTLEGMGYTVEASHHEVASGQHEIDFEPEEALRTADKMMTFKLVVKTVAKRHGLAATFMPKPFTDLSGSGLHTNMCLMKDGENAFYSADDPHGLSPIAKSFMAGIMAHGAAITAITNPLVNSYKRLVPGYEAPIYIAWAIKNRSPLIRIPTSRANETCLELRSPDPSCNPYLAFAAILEAGLDGIEKGMTAPAPIEGNLFQMTQAERDAMGVKTLPESLSAALEALESDDIIRKALGTHASEKFLEAKWLEWNTYRMTVHQWELEQYLNSY